MRVLDRTLQQRMWKNNTLKKYAESFLIEIRGRVIIRLTNQIFHFTTLV
jgi:hypothetical protein